jgi:hypothetical protein
MSKLPTKVGGVPLLHILFFIIFKFFGKIYKNI